LRAHETEIKVRGARVIAIGLGGMDYARSFRQETGLEFPLLVDSELSTYHRIGLKKGNIFHLFRSDNFAWRKRARAAGHRQHSFGRDPFQLNDPFQLGGTFVFGPGDVDHFTHVSRTFGDNAPLEAVIAAIPSR
jgi:hypothetical protein